MEIPALWFDPEEPPRLVGIDGSEEISAPSRDGTGGSRKSYAPADFRQAVEEEGSMAAAVVV